MSGADFAARGLATRVAATAASNGRLLRALQQGALRNPVDLPEGGGTLATVTPKPFASGTAGLTQEINQTSRPLLFQWSGGVATYNTSTNGWRAPVVTQRSGGNFSATRNALAQRFSFLTDAASLDVFTYFSAYRVLVNGQYVGKAVRTDGNTAGGYNRLNITPAETMRQLRRFDIEMAASNIGGRADDLIKTIAIAPADTMVPLDTSARLRIAVIGDSFTTSTGASWAFNGWAPLLGYLLGGIDVDVRQIAIGGTGYANDGTYGVSGTPPQQYTFADHIADLAQAPFDLVVFAGGINDAGMVGTVLSAAQYQAAVLATLRAARAIQPGAPMIVLGPWAGSSGPNAASVVVETAIQAAVAALGDAGAVFVPVCTDAAGAWISSGNGAAINGTGAAGGGSPDGTHPGDAGHLYLGRRANGAIRTALRTMLG